MDIFKLDSEYKRVELIENWNSLVWAERYSQNGDFELISPHISETLALLPLSEPYGPPVLVALGESDVPMVVESHTISTPANSPPQIVTKGRSFDTVLDRRVTVFSVDSDEPPVETRLDAPSVSSLVHTVATMLVSDGVPTLADRIPEINLLNGIVESGEDISTYSIEAKNLYAWMIETLAAAGLGLRAELGPSTTQIAVIIYKGTDRTTEVVFDVALDQVDDAKYVLSTAQSKNVMITATKNGMEYSAIGGPYEGLSRRVAYQDLSSEITIPPSPELTELTKNRGIVALGDLTPVSLFSGGVSRDLSFGYGQIYSLGDIVTLQGEFGLSQRAQVAEFIRTEDATGYKAYPTFVSEESTAE